MVTKTVALKWPGVSEDQRRGTSLDGRNHQLPCTWSTMQLTEKQRTLLRELPGVDVLMNAAEKEADLDEAPRSVLTASIRAILEELRASILSGKDRVDVKDLSEASILEQTRNRVNDILAPNLIPVINAAGVVVHTNLGRSRLADAALEDVLAIAGRYSNLEFDLSRGSRGSRYSAVEDLLCELTGAEAAMVVNNNAGAVLLCLDTLASGRGVIVSRGELVEIGGSFRIPDVMAKSGAILKEVGATNRTHPADYERAIDGDSAMLLKVHQSNFSIVGFTAEASLKDLVDMGEKHGVLVMEDLGSGTLIDFSKYGLSREPTVQDSVAAGVDVITFSGDKLLGGPQAGVIVGKREIMERIKSNPLTRALRVDKMTLAGLESTLRLYRNEEEAVRDIPTLRMITLPLEEVRKKAERLAHVIMDIGREEFGVALIDGASKTGGGALPLLNLPSKCVEVRVEHLSANAVERFMRAHTPPIIRRTPWYSSRRTPG